MTQQPDGLDPNKTEMWVAEQSWGRYRMYWSEKKARQYNTWVHDKDENGCWYRNEEGKYVTRPAKIFKVTLNWEEI